jgi:hypothetical protein
MSRKNPLISICIPAYNRPGQLRDLLASIASQDFFDYEVVVCEDCSSERLEIRVVVDACISKYGNIIRYLENDRNLGYDGNLRKLIANAQGDYCLFMGNDDLFCPGGLTCTADYIRRHVGAGVFLRSYVSFVGIPGNIVQEFKYFDAERFFPPCAQTVAAFFRRSVVISGMVIHRESALRYTTDETDGSLLYQLHLVGNILLDRPGVYIAQPTVLYRVAGVPDFGNSAAERGKFVPGRQTPDSSVRFVQGMLDIAQRIEERRGVDVYDRILRDIGNYSYPFLQLHAHLPLPTFTRYALDLAKLGLCKNEMFYLYFLALLLLGRTATDRLIDSIKRRRGSTPVIGNVFRGEAV